VGLTRKQYISKQDLKWGWSTRS